jgi:hypothetical protein
VDNSFSLDSVEYCDIPLAASLENKLKPPLLADRKNDSPKKKKPPQSAAVKAILVYR